MPRIPPTLLLFFGLLAHGLLISCATPEGEDTPAGG